MLKLGIIISVIYWVLSAVIDVFIFGRENLGQEIFIPSAYELVKRFLVVSLIMAMSLYFRRLLRKREVRISVTNEENKSREVKEASQDHLRINQQEEEIRHNYLIQAVINSLLRFSLENITLEGFLKCALGVILSTPWFCSESKGAIYLVEDEPEVLVLKAQSNLSPATVNRYRRIPFSQHLCGQAAQSATIQFAGSLSDSDEIKQGNIRAYAHYCVPILYGGHILGVMDIYLKEGHIRQKREEDFLTLIANTLAGVIQRKEIEDRLRRINNCFINLGIDPLENIQHLLNLCGAILRPTIMVYNRFDSLHNNFETIGYYSICGDYTNGRKLYEPIYHHIIKQQGTFVAEDISEISKDKDFLFKASHFQAYIGQAVRYRNDYIGVICGFYKDKFILREEDKELLGIIASAIGIEEGRRRSNQELSDAYEKLKKTQYGLVQSEKLAALGRFSSGMAHEVKNPLGIILGGIEYLEKKLPAVDKDIEVAIRKIKESTLRADNVVRNLLKFALPSEIKTERVQPQVLINDTLALVRYRVSLINIDIITDFSKEDIYIAVDRNQLQQVLFNLIMNAVEAMSKGGSIRIKTQKAILTELFADKPVCIIEVIDTGAGIPEGNLPKLFEPFFTTKRDKKGTGLGLSISKIIVENHKGVLTIESESGKGTVAKIILPVVE